MTNSGDDEFVSNCPISRPIQMKGITISQFFNGIGWSPQIGWVYDAPADAEPIEPPGTT
jgi:hypothetical protein